MELIYYKNEQGNFGDDLNPIFFNAICSNYESINKKYLIGIGTLLNESRGVIDNSIIFGSGFGQGIPPRINHDTTDIIGVRGPITASALGLDADKSVIGDPALYLPNIPIFNTGKSLTKSRYIIGLHHRTSEFWDFSSKYSHDFFFLTPSGNSLQDYIATIRSADIVFAESMHSAIVAAAYGIPFFRIDFLGKTDPHKWTDFFASIDIHNEPNPTLMPRPNQSAIRNFKLKLASKGIINSKDVFMHRQKVNEVELERIYSDIKELLSKSMPIISNRNRILNLQTRLEMAIDKLNHYLE